MRQRTLLAAFLCGSVLSTNAPAAAVQDGAVPDFAPKGYTGWRAAGPTLIPSPSGPQPVTLDKAYPLILTRPMPIADLTNPNLLAWVVDALRAQNQKVLSGASFQINNASCRPMGVPAFLAQWALPVFIIQGANEVLMIQESNNEVRHIFLNQPHSPKPKTSWFGESVGHYENGDSLVVDTIGLNDRTFVDAFGTPHTTGLHVIERWKLAGDGKAIEVRASVEDSGAFKSPYEVTQHYRAVAPGAIAFRAEGQLQENPCAEKPDDPLHRGMIPPPQADKPDF